MAFDKKNFSGNLGSGSGAAKLYVFRDTASTKAQVAASGYFNTLAGILEVGDATLCNCSDGTIILICATNNGTTVTTELLETTTV